MGTVTITSDTGTLTYSDYLAAKAPLRLAELQTVGVQNIIRSKTSPAVVAVMVSPAWYAAKKAGFTAVNAAVPLESQTNQTDDYLAGNLSTMVNLLNGNAEVPGKNYIDRIVDQGSNNAAFKTFTIINTLSATAADTPYDASQGVGTNYGGTVLGMMLNVAVYNALSASPQATGYTGTGNGTISVQLTPSAVAENITVTCTSTVGGGTFSVTGSTSGSWPSAVVGTPLTTANFTLTLTAGTVAFTVGDSFTVVSTAAAY